MHSCGVCSHAARWCWLFGDVGEEYVLISKGSNELHSLQLLCVRPCIFVPAQWDLASKDGCTPSDRVSQTGIVCITLRDIKRLPGGESSTGHVAL
jgi:hypothetical protein